MNKSHLSKTSNRQPVVTVHDVGSFVQVAGIGRGLLRYVGCIAGKDGLFCGIELEEDIGKHDGNYMGISYFKCPPRRGIFAPPYKVELEVDDDTLPEMTDSQLRRTQQRLSRSALASLPLRNVFRPEAETSYDDLRGNDHRSRELRSSDSRSRDNSAHDPRENDLRSREMRSSEPRSRDHSAHNPRVNDLRSRDLSRSEPRSRDPSAHDVRTYDSKPRDVMMTSIYSDGGSLNLDAMDASMFSQVSWGDVGDMASSHATYVVPHGNSIFDKDEDLMSLQAPKRLLNIDREAIRREEERILTSTSIVVENPVHSEQELPHVYEDDEDLETPMVEAPPIMPAPHIPQAPPIDEVPPTSQTPPIVEDLPAEDTPPVQATSPTEEKPKSARKLQNGTSKIASKKGVETEQKMEETVQKKEKVEKPAVPVVPKFPIKPKPPSKHQLMMEQLKASIEADKNKPKKEIKARVPLVPPPSAPKNREEIMEKKKKTPLKAVNEPISAPKEERVKKERKPLYVPPPPREKKEVAPKVEKLNGVVDAKRIERPSSTSSSKKSFPTSSFAGTQLARKTAPGTSKKAPECENSEKLNRLRRASEAVDVFSLLLSQKEKQGLLVRNRLTDTETQLVREKSSCEELRRQLKDREKKHLEELDRLKHHMDTVSRTHADTVEKLKLRHDGQLEDKNKEAERMVEDERSRHEVEMEAMSRRHQMVILSLDEKIAEAEKTSEALTADKKALQAALANDSDQRNQMLTKEIASLQTALEFKSSEMKELRQKYQQVALRVEEIPIKELEIAKLKHKVSELKQTLEQKITYEKLLIHQNEELKKQQLAISEEKDTMQRSMDVIMYHMQNENEDLKTPQSNCGSNQKVQFRSRSSASDRSAIPAAARLSHGSHNETEQSYDRDSLTRSSISMFTSQIKLPENHADDVIYAPDQIILGDVCKRLSFSEDGTKVLGTSDPQTDSGIGI